MKFTRVVRNVKHGFGIDFLIELVFCMYGMINMDWF